MVCTGCCATLDHIVTHLFKQMSMKGKVRRGQTMPENDALVQVVKMHPEILQQVKELCLKKIGPVHSIYILAVFEMSVVKK